MSFSNAETRSSLATTELRPVVRGKFLFIGAEKFYLRGVTYGTFQSDEQGVECLDPEVVERDFGQMAAHNINTVRVYTVPPRWLLDAAQRHGLRVMVGLPWEQHVAFLETKAQAHAIEARVRAGVQACAGHPAVLCFTIGNEIPTSLVRWYGARRVAAFLKRLYRAVKAEDPQALVTYVNYPSTEYLKLPFLDFVCFNVYLEERERYEGYLARLQTLAEDRPLVMAEIGLDSQRNGEDRQASTLRWQLRTAFDAGCAGAVVFAWTDEWHRGGEEILDWDFGLTDRVRGPKLALAAVAETFAQVPFPSDIAWPRVSVVVCSYNGARTIGDCCAGLSKLAYPNFEVIVVDDGSTDATAAIASAYPFYLASTPNQGLSNARNLGLELASGEIVAYLDDDAYPDPHWLHYLARTFMRTSHAGVGGPNIAPPGDGFLADCVDNAPGNPTHILLSDQEAEHIPGCNMAFRKSALLAIQGFDPGYRVAGDDVDVCWRMRQSGGTLGFNAGAMVWHHRRRTLRTFWKQQYGYGKAEALLERKWPEKYNAAGYLTWEGRIAGKGQTLPLGRSSARVNYGTWGTELFQSVYEPTGNGLWALPLMPEWYLVLGSLALLSLLGLAWSPLLLLLPLLLAGVAISLAQALLSASRATFQERPAGLLGVTRTYGLTAFLHLYQTAARLYARVSNGLTPWRRRGVGHVMLPRSMQKTIWKERGPWRSQQSWLGELETLSGASGAAVTRGDAYARWDLQVRGSIFGAARLRVGVEEHGPGRQLVRVQIWPRWSALMLALTCLWVVLAAGAAAAHAWLAALALGTIAAVFVVRMVLDCGQALSTAAEALAKVKPMQPDMVSRPEVAVIQPLETVCPDDTFVARQQAVG
jgi:O-antigen biosynthesis protein